MSASAANDPIRPRLHRTLGVMDLVFLNVCAVLGIRWLSTSLAPGLTDFSTLTFFATITFAFAGLELSSTMGDEIVDPLDRNPLVDISDIRDVSAVMSNGNYYESAPLWRAADFQPSRN